MIEEGKVSEVNDAWFNADGSFNNRHYPNAIDANLFYDTEGKLYMVYGSWSGGIYLLELDKETGEVIYPKEDSLTEDGRMIDRYFGTKISGGHFESGEGPYVEYNEATGYYYLHVTYGWLGADGGYHMRQFRSENPTGPYVDAAGQPAVLPPNQSNTQFGNRLMGNFLFLRDDHEQALDQDKAICRRDIIRCTRTRYESTIPRFPYAFPESGRKLPSARSSDVYEQRRLGRRRTKTLCG